MIFQEVWNIYVAYTITIGEHEGLVANILLDAFDAGACLSIETCIDQGDLPGLGNVVMYGHSVVIGEVEGNIRGVQVIVGKIFFDHVALVAKTDDEFMKTISGIDFHDMPEDGITANFNHWFWSQIGFFADAGTESASQDDYFHRITPSLLLYILKIRDIAGFSCYYR